MCQQTIARLPQAINATIGQAIFEKVRDVSASQSPEKCLVHNHATARVSGTISIDQYRPIRCWMNRQRQARRRGKNILLQP
jgi:hypothetical protein